MIRVSTASAAANGFQAFARFDELCAAVVRAHALHQYRGLNAERLREGHDSLQTRADAAGLEPAEHRAADAGAPRDIRERQILRHPQPARGPTQIDGGIL